MPPVRLRQRGLSSAVPTNTRSVGLSHRFPPLSQPPASPLLGMVGSQGIDRDGGLMAVGADVFSVGYLAGSLLSVFCASSTPQGVCDLIGNQICF